MDYRRLGNSDLKVSAVCLGTMTFGEQNSEAEAHAQLDYAFEHHAEGIWAGTTTRDRNRMRRGGRARSARRTA